MDTPFITYDERRRLWTLERDCVVESRGWSLVIPSGFAFDLASIPRFLWNVVAPFELSISAPLVHDWLYSHAGKVTAVHEGIRFNVCPAFTKKDADDFFLDLMEKEGVSPFRRKVAYYAVRLFGRGSW